MISLLGILFLMGCATVDLSLLDTAVPLKAGQTQIMEYQVVGTNPFTTTGLKNNTPGDFSDIIHGSISSEALLCGWQGSVGLGHGLELGGKFFTGSGFLVKYSGSGYKGYFKMRLYHPNDKISIAIIPTYSFVVGKAGDKSSNSFWNFNGETYQYQINGFELPILYTFKEYANSPARHTLICRFTHEDATISYRKTGFPELSTDQEYQGLIISRIGIYYNLDLAPRSDRFNLAATCGFEAGPFGFGQINYQPVFGLGLKFKGDVYE
jgi:hypothetical protein